MSFAVPEDWPADVQQRVGALSERYDFTDQSTNGQNGYVVFGRNRITNAKIAVKFYYWGGAAAFHLEPQALTALGGASPYILKVWDAGFAGEEWAYYVTPKCTGGDLESLISKGFCGTKRAIDIASDVLHGLCYMHPRRLIHRDLKPGNIYLDSKRAIIGDFGSVAEIPEGQASVPASQHSLLYRPPESCASDEYAVPGDIYQVGVLLYQLLGGHLPYEEMAWLTEPQKLHAAALTSPDDRIYIDSCIKDRIIKGRLIEVPSLPPVVDERMKKIIRKATHKDPTKRYATAADFLAKLSDAKTRVRNWTPQGNGMILKDRTSYQIIGDGPYEVQKRKTGSWKNDRQFDDLADLAKLVKAIEQRPQR